MTQVVPISRVKPNNRDTRAHTFVNRMMRVLQTQGQIEPLQVKAVNGGFVTFDEDAWGSEILLAARILGWKTILIVEVTRYQY
jgi:hypothetical protein